MNKRVMQVLLAGALAFGLAGCGGSSGRTTPSGQQGVSDVLQEQMQGDRDQESVGTASGAVAAATDPTYTDDQVDIDLTAMNADMVYATVYDIMQHGDDYVGKVIRAGGQYYHTFYEETASDYYYVLIQDATACCAQGLEFVWGNGRHVYPDDYPQDGVEATVTGVFEPYLEGENAYAHLVNAEFSVNA